MAPEPRQPGRPATRALTPAELRALAEKVYRLMLADLRLERARGARPGDTER